MPCPVGLDAEAQSGEAAGRGVSCQLGWESGGAEGRREWGLGALGQRAALIVGGGLIAKEEMFVACAEKEARVLSEKKKSQRSE